MNEELLDIPLALEALLVDFLRMLPGLIAALVIFLVGLLLTFLITRALRIALQRRDIKPEAASVLVKITYISLITLILVISLQQIGFNLTAFLAGLGIVGFTVGFALQDVSKNFVAGLLLLLQQPFKIGETVEVVGFTGEILEIDLRASRMRDLDGRIVLIPNADVFTSPIINYSQAKLRRIEILIGIASESDLDLTRQTALEAVKGIAGFVDDPAPNVIFQRFGEYAIELGVYFWINTEVNNPLRAKDAAIQVVNAAFLENKIEMPTPYQALIRKAE